MGKVVYIEEGKEDGARAQVIRGEAQGLHPTGPLLRPACHKHLLRGKQAVIACTVAIAAATRMVAVAIANSGAVCMC